VALGKWDEKLDEVDSRVLNDFDHRMDLWIVLEVESRSLSTAHSLASHLGE